MGYSGLAIVWVLTGSTVALQYARYKYISDLDGGCSAGAFSRIIPLLKLVLQRQ